MPASAKEIRHCEVCGAQNLPVVLNLGGHPLCDDLVAIGSSRQCREYPIEILFCHNCVTAHQRFQVPKAKLFPPTYHYRSRQTADVLNGMRELVGAYQARLGSLSGRKVLDIGCNDGSLLSIFRECGALTYGIEPTGAAHDATVSGHTVVNDFLSETVATEFVAARGQPEVITFTNVFAHIDDLRSVIRALKVLVSPQTTIIIENHYLGAIIERNQFDTFYHEHPRTYSYRSFHNISVQLDIPIISIEFPKRYGGNIRVFLRHKATAGAYNTEEAMAKREGGYGTALRNLSEAIAEWRANKLTRLGLEFRRHGKLPAKAFPGRAAILIKLLGLDESQIEAVYEKPGSMKIGHYLPGTRIPIRSDDDFQADTEHRPLINLAWHIPAEIHSYMRDRGYRGPIIDIIGTDDFRDPI